MYIFEAFNKSLLKCFKVNKELSYMTSACFYQEAVSDISFSTFLDGLQVSETIYTERN